MLALSWTSSLLSSPAPPPVLQEAIDRLAGKSAKRKEFKEDMQIIDINEEDMKVSVHHAVGSTVTCPPPGRPAGVAD